MDIFIQRHVPLSKYTTYRTGGEAKYFATIENEDQLIKSLAWANQNKINVFILGGGSNLLISDDGFDGLVLKIQNNKQEILKKQNKYISTFGAGVTLMTALNYMFDYKLVNLIDLVGIPGSIGGAVRGNAGVSNKEISNGILKVTAIKYSHLSKFNSKTKSVTLSKNKCSFHYRDSIFKHQPYIIWEVQLIDQPAKITNQEIKNKIQEILMKRHKSQPYSLPSAGCVFKNIPLNRFPKKFQNQTSLVVIKKGKTYQVPAGYLIEQSGLKGYQIGGAQVSNLHANFIVNSNNAKSADIYKLIQHIKQVVFKRFGVKLEEEIELVGFKQ